MLLEGVVAVIAIGTVMLSGVVAKGGPTITYAEGFGKFASIVGIDPKIGMSLGLLAINSFLLTSLDTATRLTRYQIQSWTNMKVDKYTATSSLLPPPWPCFLSRPMDPRATSYRHGRQSGPSSAHPTSSLRPLLSWPSASGLPRD